MKFKYVVGLLFVLVLMTAQGCQKNAVKKETPIVSEPETVTQPETPQTPETKAPETPKETTPTGADVRILSNGFEPETVAISVGGTVTWKNMDARQHLLIVGGDRSQRLDGATLQESADGKKELVSGGTWEKTFDAVGTYEVMDVMNKFKGSVVVS